MADLLLGAKRLHLSELFCKSSCLSWQLDSENSALNVDFSSGQVTFFFLELQFLNKGLALRSRVKHERFAESLEIFVAVFVEQLEAEP